MNAWFLFLSAFASGWVGFSLVSIPGNRFILIFVLILNLGFAFYRIYQLGGF